MASFSSVQIFAAFILLWAIEHTSAFFSFRNVTVDYGPDLGKVSSIKTRSTSFIYFAPDSLDEIHPKFYLYTRANQYRMATLDYLNNQSLDTTLLDVGKMTYFLIHGWTESGLKKSYLNLKNVLLDKFNSNVIVADFEKGVRLFPGVAQALVNGFVVSRVASRLLYLLHDRRGLDLKKLHLIGFSMGGQMAGKIGRWFIQNLNITIGRISAVDPSPKWYVDHLPEALKKEDADFVDVTHANIGQTITPWGFIKLGIKQQSGHVDFYVNGGRFQPQCVKQTIREEISNELVACSHFAALRYYTESISSQCNFTSYPCPAVLTSDSSKDWSKCNNCGNNNCGRLGFYSNLAPGRGLQYLTTNSNPPPYCIK